MTDNFHLEHRLMDELYHHLRQHKDLKERLDSEARNAYQAKEIIKVELRKSFSGELARELALSYIDSINMTRFYERYIK